VPLVVLTACEYVVVYCCTPCDGFRLILVGTLPLEQLVMVSMQPSVLKAAVLSYDELFAGQVLPGTVSKVVVVPVGDPAKSWPKLMRLCISRCQPSLSTAYWSALVRVFVVS
jgi:hypothetical protein